MQNRLQLITSNLFVLSFVLSALGQIGRVVLFGNAHFYLYEVFLLVTLLLMIWQLRSLPFEKLKLLEISSSMKGFLLWTAFSLLLSLIFFILIQNIVAFLYFCRLAMYMILFSYVLCWVLKGYISEALLFSGFKLFFIILVATGLIQYLYYPNLRNLTYAGWDPHFYRAFGTYLEPVVFATIMGLFAVYFLLHKRNVLYLLLTIVSAMGIVASYSRAVYVGLVAVFLTVFRNQIHWKGVISVLCLVAGLLLLFPRPGGEGVNLFRTSTAFSRVEDYLQGLAISTINPISGIGYNHIGSVKRIQSAPEVKINYAASSFHSSFLVILATTGAIGLLLYLKWLQAVMSLNKYFVASGVFLIVVSLFDNMLLHPFVMFTWLYVGSVSLLSRT